MINEQNFLDKNTPSDDINREKCLKLEKVINDVIASSTKTESQVDSEVGVGADKVSLHDIEKISETLVDQLYFLEEQVSRLLGDDYFYQSYKNISEKLKEFIKKHEGEKDVKLIKDEGRELLDQKLVDSLDDQELSLAITKTFFKTGYVYEKPEYFLKAVNDLNSLVEKKMNEMPESAKMSDGQKDVLKFLKAKFAAEINVMATKIGALVNSLEKGELEIKN